MERGNRIFFTAAQDSPMNGNRRPQPEATSEDPHHQPLNAGLSFIPNHHHHRHYYDGLINHPYAAAVEDMGLLPNNLSAYPYNLLEHGFSRLSLDSSPALPLPPPQPFVATPPAYTNGGGGVLDSNIWINNNNNNSAPNGYGLSNGGGDINRMRAQSAAIAQAAVLYTQPGNYQAGLDHNNLSGLSVYGNSSSNQTRTTRNNNSHYDVVYGGNQFNRNNNNSYNMINPEVEYSNGFELRNLALPLIADHLGNNGYDVVTSPKTVYELARKQHGCRYLQSKFEGGNRDEIGMIFNGLKGHFCELMYDQFGNYLMQKMFDVCNQMQMSELLSEIIATPATLKHICTDMHGTRAVQKLLERLRTREQRASAVQALSGIALDLTKNGNGHHVIKHCLEIFSFQENEKILSAVADHCIEIATDKSGCCVLQPCIDHAQGEAFHRLIAEITCNALFLSEHPFGNYVVQYVIGLRDHISRADIMKHLQGQLVSLSMNKHASNVVEKLLKAASDDEANVMIMEIINSPNVVSLLQDPYGNYVAQSALEKVHGKALQAMINTINAHYAFLHSHPHGKRVLARSKAIIKQRL